MERAFVRYFEERLGRSPEHFPRLRTKTVRSRLPAIATREHKEYAQRNRNNCKLGNRTLQGDVAAIKRLYAAEIADASRHPEPLSQPPGSTGQAGAAGVDVDFEPAEMTDHEPTAMLSYSEQVPSETSPLRLSAIMRDSDSSTATSESCRKRSSSTMDAPSADHGDFGTVSSKRLRSGSSGLISNSFAEVVGQSGRTKRNMFKKAAAAERAERGALIGKGNHEVHKVQYAVKNTSSRDGTVEAGIMQQLQHKNTVRLIEKRRRGHRVDLVMELMDCGDLKEFVKYSQLDEDHIAYIAREILSGLAFMHGKGYVHCDLKTNNVLARSDGAIKIGDFDRTMELSMLDIPRGTKGFTAPEAIRRCNGDDVACGTPIDVYSLGCLLVDVHRSVRGGIQKHVSLGYAAAYPDCDASELVAVIESCSPPLHTFLRRCLVVDPAERPSADELLADPFLQKAPTGAKKFAAMAKLYCTERKNARIQQELQVDRENYLSTHLSLL